MPWEEIAEAFGLKNANSAIQTVDRVRRWLQERLRQDNTPQVVADKPLRIGIGQRTNKGGTPKRKPENTNDTTKIDRQPLRAKIQDGTDRAKSLKLNRAQSLIDKPNGEITARKTVVSIDNNLKIERGYDRRSRRNPKIEDVNVKVDKQPMSSRPDNNNAKSLNTDNKQSAQSQNVSDIPEPASESPAEGHSPLAGNRLSPTQNKLCESAEFQSITAELRRGVLDHVEKLMPEISLLASDMVESDEDLFEDVTGDTLVAILELVAAKAELSEIFKSPETFVAWLSQTVKGCLFDEMRSRRNRGYSKGDSSTPTVAEIDAADDTSHITRILEEGRWDDDLVADLLKMQNTKPDEFQKYLLRFVDKLSHEGQRQILIMALDLDNQGYRKQTEIAKTLGKKYDWVRRQLRRGLSELQELCRTDLKEDPVIDESCHDNLQALLERIIPEGEDPGKYRVQVLGWLTGDDILKRKERLAIILKWGLDGNDPRTHDQVAARLRVQRSHAIIARAIAELKKRCRAAQEENPIVAESAYERLKTLLGTHKIIPEGKDASIYRERVVEWLLDNSVDENKRRQRRCLIYKWDLDGKGNRTDEQIAAAVGLGDVRTIIRMAIAELRGYCFGKVQADPTIGESSYDKLKTLLVDHNIIPDGDKPNKYVAKTIDCLKTDGVLSRVERLCLIMSWRLGEKIFENKAEMTNFLGFRDPTSITDNTRRAKAKLRTFLIHDNIKALLVKHKIVPSGADPGKYLSRILACLENDGNRALKLSEQERRCVRLAWNLDRTGKKSTKQIGLALGGVSIQRVHVIIDAAIAKLQMHFNPDPDIPLVVALDKQARNRLKAALIREHIISGDDDSQLAPFIAALTDDSVLVPRERRIVLESWGLLPGAEPKTDAKIGAELNRSGKQIRVISTAAVNKLRALKPSDSAPVSTTISTEESGLAKIKHALLEMQVAEGEDAVLIGSEELQQRMQALNEQETEIIRRYYLDEQTLETIGKSLGKRNNVVYNIKLRALTKLSRPREIADSENQLALATNKITSDLVTMMRGAFAEVAKPADILPIMPVKISEHEFSRNGQIYNIALSAAEVLAQLSYAFGGELILSLEKVPGRSVTTKEAVDEIGKEFPERIEQIRNELSLTQASIANTLKIRFQTVNQWLKLPRGQIQRFSRFLAATGHRPTLSFDPSPNQGGGDRSAIDDHRSTKKGKTTQRDVKKMSHASGSVPDNEPDVRILTKVNESEYTRVLNLPKAEWQSYLDNLLVDDNTQERSLFAIYAIDRLKDLACKAKEQKDQFKEQNKEQMKEQMKERKKDPSIKFTVSPDISNPQGRLFDVMIKIISKDENLSVLNTLYTVKLEAQGETKSALTKAEDLPGEEILYRDIKNTILATLVFIEAQAARVALQPVKEEIEVARQSVKAAHEEALAARQELSQAKQVERAQPRQGKASVQPQLQAATQKLKAAHAQKDAAKQIRDAALLKLRKAGKIDFSNLAQMARVQIVEDNDHLLKHLVGKATRQFTVKEDLFQEGVVALLKAVQTYNYERS